MTRRTFVTAKQIWAARAFWWTDHYQKREQAKAYTEQQAERVLDLCKQMPSPMLDIDGSLDDWNYHAARAKPVHETIDLAQQAGVAFAMLVKWYWSETEWQSFVQQFNSLPEPEPMYEILHNLGYPKLEVVPYIMGTTLVQSRNKSLVVPIQKHKR
jgi:hypothetical protein